MISRNFTVAQYLADIVKASKNSKKYPFYYARLYLDKIYGPLSGSAVNGFKRLAEETGHGVKDILPYAADKFLSEAAIDDLVLYSQEIGLGALYARKEDLWAETQGWGICEVAQFTDLERYGNSLTIEIVLDDTMAVPEELPDNVSESNPLSNEVEDAWDRHRKWLDSEDLAALTRSWQN